MEVTTLGIDLAKTVFQLHGVNSGGQKVLQRKVRRSELLQLVAQLKPCLIGIEACSSAYYWARKFSEHGHTVRLMAPQYVKPYVKTNKNDFNDAEAICEAVTRPNMHFVPIKSVEQQDIQALHRVRSRLIAERTALANSMHGLLLEYGIVVERGVRRLLKQMHEAMSDGSNGLTPLMRETLQEISAELVDVNSRIAVFDRKIERIFKNSEVCRRLGAIDGVGQLSATAIVAAVGDARVFKNGRQMAAWLGLVPRQHSSGKHVRLLGISKRGDKYLRTLLIHGARAAVLHSGRYDDKRSRWIQSKLVTRGPNKTYVAVANKNVRVIWKMLITGESYRQAA